MDRIKGNRAAELDFSEDTKRFLRELFGESIGSPSADQKLDAIIEMQKQFEIRMGLLETRAETIHGLVFDLTTGDPEKIKEVAASVKAVREKLKTSVDSQQKEK